MKIRHHSVRPKKDDTEKVNKKEIGIDGCADEGNEDGNVEGRAEEEVREEGAKKEDDEQVVDEEGIAPPVVRSPRTPSKKEIDDHNKTHLPFQGWCAACVKGRGVGRPPSQCYR